MKNYLFNWILLPALFYSSITVAQTDFQCPNNIGYKPNGIPDCGGSFNQPGFYMNFPGEKPVPPLYFTLDFDGANCQGFQVFTNLSCGGWECDINGSICQNLTPTGTIQITSKNTVCHYTNGHLDDQYSMDLIPCYDFLNSCKEPLKEFARDFIQIPPNCKIWEGPCAPESEIWRTGNVCIGTSSPGSSGGKLTVKGGVTTEMLQICKSEWCDFVFSDSFQLKSLPETATFIEENRYLPGCTPGLVIQREGGFSLDEETVNQQQKIEEIFLHLITAQHRLDDLEKNLNVHMSTITRDPISDYHGEEYPERNVQVEVNAVLLQYECFQIKPSFTSGGDGIGGVLITPFLNQAYNLIWSGPTNGALHGVYCNGAIKIPNLKAGTYSVTISTDTGPIGTCGFTIESSNGNQPDCSIFSDVDCKEIILDMLEAEAFPPPLCKQWEGDPCSHEDNIYRLGNVSIGTSVGKVGYSLAVKGGIITDKFLVQLCESGGWCDYVFDKNYNLPSLSEVENHIKSCHALPGMVTQADVTRDGGFEVKTVKLDQQEKIEEAFLYLIQLNKQKNQLTEELNLLIEQN